MKKNNANMSKIEEREIEIQGSMGKLYGLLELPRTQTPLPNILILCHGLMGECHSPLFDELSVRLLAAKIGCLRFDFNGCGKSEGDYSKMTILNEIQDLMAVIGYVQRECQIQSIGVLGHSMGGVIAGMAAAAMGAPTISTLFMLSPACNAREDVLRGNIFGESFDPWNAPEAVPLPNGRKLGKSYIQTVLGLDIYDAITKYNGLTFILHGMADRVVPYTCSSRLHGMMKDSVMKLLPGEDHRYSTNLPMTIEVVMDWVVDEFQFMK